MSVVPAECMCSRTGSTDHNADGSLHQSGGMLAMLLLPAALKAVVAQLDTPEALRSTGRWGDAAVREHAVTLRVRGTAARAARGRCWQSKAGVSLHRQCAVRRAEDEARGVPPCHSTRERCPTWLPSSRPCRRCQSHYICIRDYLELLASASPRLRNLEVHNVTPEGGDES